MCNPVQNSNQDHHLLLWAEQLFWIYSFYNFMLCLLYIFPMHSRFNKENGILYSKASIFSIYYLRNIICDFQLCLHAQFEAFQCVSLKIYTAKPDACIRREESVLKLWAQLTAWRKSFTQPIVRLVTFAHSVDSENVNQSHAAQPRSACNWFHFLDPNSTNK